MRSCGGRAAGAAVWLTAVHGVQERAYASRGWGSHAGTQPPLRRTSLIRSHVRVGYVAAGAEGVVGGAWGVVAGAGGVGARIWGVVAGGGWWGWLAMPLVVRAWRYGERRASARWWGGRVVPQKVAPPIVAVWIGPAVGE
jgi:hypothetical protein